MKLRGLVPNFTFMYLWAIYIFQLIGPPILCSKVGGPIVGIFKSLSEAWMWKFGTRPRSFISGIFVSSFPYSVLAGRRSPRDQTNNILSPSGFAFIGQLVCYGSQWLTIFPTILIFSSTGNIATSLQWCVKTHHGIFWGVNMGTRVKVPKSTKARVQALRSASCPA